MDDLFGSQADDTGPVECLGQTFPNDQARREHYLKLLAEKLKDPEFRKIEGFPIGSDEDILNLSDPPYYTVCPNPWIDDFIAEWEAQKPEKPESYHYHREPFAADVSEGKNDPIYNAHSYHTKVPHKAIMRYILHYTNPGDIVFDGFCGTGMTGVAAQMCGDREVVMSLGYQVKPDGTILQEEMDEDGKKIWRVFSKLGVRRAVLNDLSPAATFIAYNYNTPVDVAAFAKEAKRILKEVEKECGWMYGTKHSDGRTGKVNHILWSDVFTCPECANEVVFWEAAVDKDAGKINNEFPCPTCGALLTKRNMDRSWISKYDRAISQNVRQTKQVPVVISYSVNGKRFEKTPDKLDITLLAKSDEADIPYWFPVTEIPVGDKTGEPLRIGLSRIHHFYTQSALHEMASLWSHFNSLEFRISRACLLSHTAASPYASKLRRFRADKKGGGPLAGTLYIASLITPPNPVLTVGRNVDFVARGLSSIQPKLGSVIVSAQSNNHYSYIGNDSLDYIFIDPPFGSNLNYSELNLLWEAWLKVITNNEQEAIENKTQGKGATEYRQIMTACFREAYRVLKPGRWMTVEFSNTKASVWNSIQTSITEAGFIVANVSALDKKQGSFNAVTNTTSVKQDLVISAYKPNGGFEERFQKESQTEEGVWNFVRTHLKYLPVTKQQGAFLQFVPERDPRILFDRMVAYYIRKGYPVPISSQEFQEGLRQNFVERDDMVFLPEQVAEYDKKRAQMAQAPQMELFVSDERSAIDWLTELLKKRPSTYQEIHPEFTKQLGAGWRKHEAKPELAALLEDNFLRYEGSGDVTSQIHSYLSTNHKDLRGLEKSDKRLVSKAKDRWFVPDPNKAQDLEKKRAKALLKEFETYLAFTGRKLKEFRLEVLRAGFKAAWVNKDYQTIIKLAQKIPDTSLQEDEQLLMWYDHALTRTEASG